jgi:hypothetical protein
MKKNYSLLLFFCILLFELAHAQLPPLMNAIQGPNLVCSQPASPKNFTASASNSPSTYNWTYAGLPGVVFSNPSSSVTSISFPYPYINASFTLFCSASNIAGTSNTASFVVTIKETPSVTFSGANIFCQGSSTNLSASPTILSSSSTLTYSWSPSYGLNSTINYSVTVNATVSTNYTVLLTLGTCTNTAQINVIVIPCALGINSSELNYFQQIETYPNPNTGNFTILSDRNVRVTLLNELGQTIQNLELVADEKRNITGLKPGIYFIVGANTRKKIVVTN